MTRRHTTGPIHPEARKWHIKRLLRENGYISTRAWAMWVVAYVETLDASPWRTFCLRELGRVTGDYAALRMDEARRQERERLDEVADALSSLDK